MLWLEHCACPELKPGRLERQLDGQHLLRALSDILSWELEILNLFPPFVPIVRTHAYLTFQGYF